MSRIFGPNNPLVPVPVVEPAPVDEWQVRMLAALDQLAAAVLDRPAPVVEVPPVDLGEIVMAVQALKGPATADEIAEALARVLQPGHVEPAESEALREVVDALKKLDFRLKAAPGSMGTGGGSVQFSPKGLEQLGEALGGTGLTDAELRATPVPVSGTVALGSATVTALTADPTVTAIVSTVTASGDTTVHTPASGKAIRLHWVSAINDPDEATTPLIKISLGADELYRAYAVAHRQTFEGAADAALVVNLSGAASVAFTAHLEEFTP